MQNSKNYKSSKRRRIRRMLEVDILGVHVKRFWYVTQRTLKKNRLNRTIFVSFDFRLNWNKRKLFFSNKCGAYGWRSFRLIRTIFFQGIAQSSAQFDVFQNNGNAILTNYQIWMKVWHVIQHYNIFFLRNIFSSTIFHISIILIFGNFC